MSEKFSSFEGSKNNDDAEQKPVFSSQEINTGKRFEEIKQEVYSTEAKEAAEAMTDLAFKAREILLDHDEENREMRNLLTEWGETARLLDSKKMSEVSEKLREKHLQFNAIGEEFDKTLKEVEKIRVSFFPDPNSIKNS